MDRNDPAGNVFWKESLSQGNITALTERKAAIVSRPSWDKVKHKKRAVYRRNALC